MVYTVLPRPFVGRGSSLDNRKVISMSDNKTYAQWTMFQCVLVDSEVVYDAQGKREASHIGLFMQRQNDTCSLRVLPNNWEDGKLHYTGETQKVRGLKGDLIWKGNPTYLDHLLLNWGFAIVPGSDETLARSPYTKWCEMDTVSEDFCEETMSVTKTLTHKKWGELVIPGPTGSVNKEMANRAWFNALNEVTMGSIKINRLVPEAKQKMQNESATMFSRAAKRTAANEQIPF